MKFLFILFSTFSVRYYKCEPIFPHLKMAFFYGREYYTEFFSIAHFEECLTHPAFQQNLTTVIYIHGYRESLDTENVRTVISAYLHRNDHNVFALDWSNYSIGNYVIDAVPNAVQIGKFIGISLNYWIQQNVLDDSRLHLVGHSLGAQMSGYIGKWLIFSSRGTRKVKRITGLDAARPLFYHNITGFITYIHKSDARLVDLIHTNAGLLGADISVGDCDFWPNGGALQPGCPINKEPQCDHKRSWLYYAESVASLSPIFDAVNCDSYKQFKKLNCSNSAPNFMGFHATNECSGVYYLQTNKEAPFSRGVFGLQYYPLDDSDRQN